MQNKGVEILLDLVIELCKTVDFLRCEVSFTTQAILDLKEENTQLRLKLYQRSKV